MLSADGRALSGVIHEHPFFGPLNVYQWVELIAAHEMRHVAQVREAAMALDAVMQNAKFKMQTNCDATCSACYLHFAF